MFKNTITWSSRKLFWWKALSNIVYFLLTFVGPITTVLVMFDQVTNGTGTRKIPLIALIICLSVVLASTRFLKKEISKMSILNLDGTYKNKTRTFKHILELLTKIILPAAVLVISIMFSTTMKEYIDFYVKLIIICLSFYIGGLVVDSLVISFFDDEDAIREQVKLSNAVARRQGLK